MQSGQQDVLVSIVNGVVHRSIYMLARLPHSAAEEMVRDSNPGGITVLSGGRHPEVRSAFRSLMDKLGGSLTVFNPSYAVYEYSTDNLAELVGSADVVLCNKEESAFLSRHLAGWPVNPEVTKKDLVIVMTKGQEGVEVHHGGSVESWPARTERHGLFLGAGDALTAGFAHELALTKDIEAAVLYGLEAAAAVVREGKIRVEITDADMRRRISSYR